MRRPVEYYQVRIAEDGKVLWRGMELTHIKDLSPEQRNDVLNEIRRLKEQGLGRNRIQKEIAITRSVFVPIKIIQKTNTGKEKISWERCGIRGPIRALELRIELYKMVKELHSKGLNYTQIQQAVEETFGVRLSKSLISHWCRDVCRPGNKGITLTKEITLTPDLLWLLGFIVADGYADVIHEDNCCKYRLRLASKDRVLIEKAAKVVGGSITKDKRNEIWYLKIKRKKLFDLFQKVRRLIDEGKFEELVELMGTDGTRAFIRGFFDGDGSGLFVNFTNADLQILSFIRYALMRVCHVRTSEPVLDTMKGTMSYYVSDNRWIVRKRDVYMVFVYPEDYQRFFEEVGTTLERKIYQWKLSEEILRRHSTRLERTPLDEIKRRYENGENWTEILVMLLKSVGAKTMKKRRKTPTPSFSLFHAHVVTSMGSFFPSVDLLEEAPQNGPGSRPALRRGLLYLYMHK